MHASQWQTRLPFVCRQRKNVSGNAAALFPSCKTKWTLISFSEAPADSLVGLPKQGVLPVPSRLDAMKGRLNISAPAVGVWWTPFFGPSAEVEKVEGFAGKRELPPDKPVGKEEEPLCGLLGQMSSGLAGPQALLLPLALMGWQMVPHQVSRVPF